VVELFEQDVNSAKKTTQKATAQLCMDLNAVVCIGSIKLNSIGLTYGS